MSIEPWSPVVSRLEANIFTGGSIGQDVAAIWLPSDQHSRVKERYSEWF